MKLTAIVPAVGVALALAACGSSSPPANKPPSAPPTTSIVHGDTVACANVNDDWKAAANLLAVDQQTGGTSGVGAFRQVAWDLDQLGLRVDARHWRGWARSYVALLSPRVQPAGTSTLFNEDVLTIKLHVRASCGVDLP